MLPCKPRGDSCIHHGQRYPREHPGFCSNGGSLLRSRRKCARQTVLDAARAGLVRLSRGLASNRDFNYLSGPRLRRSSMLHASVHRCLDYLQRRKLPRAGVDCVPKRRPIAHRRLRQQIILAGKIAEEGSSRNTGGLRNLFNGSLIEASLSKYLDGRRIDGVTNKLPLLISPHLRHPTPRLLKPPYRSC